MSSPALETSVCVALRFESREDLLRERSWAKRAAREACASFVGAAEVERLVVAVVVGSVGVGASSSLVVLGSGAAAAVVVSASVSVKRRLADSPCGLSDYGEGIRCTVGVMIAVCGMVC